MNSTNGGHQLANATLVGATIYSPLYPLTPQIFVNGSQSWRSGRKRPFVNSSDIVGDGASAFRVVDLALTFPGHELGIEGRGRGWQSAPRGAR